MRLFRRFFWMKTEDVMAGNREVIRSRQNRSVVELAKLSDRSAFAGSIATADRLVYIVTHEAGLDITEAVKMASYNPAKLFGLNKGAIEAGRDADILVFDEEIKIERIILGGKTV